MASEKEEIILDFKVDSGDLVTELEKLKTLIVANKKEQIQLNKAFKDGKITESEYAKETVRVETALKRQQTAYTNTQKAVLGHKSKIDELIKSNNKLSSSLSDAAKNINVAGVNIGDLTGKLSAFANPATAAVGIVTALGAAYASSTTGAKDLSFATSELSFIAGNLTEGFGRLVGGDEGGGGGKGPLSRFTDFTIRAIGATTLFGNALKLFGLDLNKMADDAQEAAKAVEQLQALEIGKAFDVGAFKQDEKRIELLRIQRDDEGRLLGDRINSIETITALYETAFQRRKTILETEIAKIKESTIGYDNNFEAQLKVAQITSEISDFEEMINGKLTENKKIREQILSIAQSEAAIAKINAAVSPEEQARILAQRGDVRGGAASADSDKTVTGRGTEIIIERAKFLEDERTRIAQQGAEDRKKTEQDSTKFFVEQEQAKLQAAAGIAGALSNLFQQGSEEQKFFALLGLGIDTAEAIGGLTAAAEQNPLNGPSFGAAGIAQYAAGIIRILGNIAAAKSYLGFASGGYTGDGDPRSVAGIVHRKEVVWNAEDVNLAGGPSVVNAMRPTARRRSSRGGGYYDGGIVAANASAQIDQQLAMANAFKNMPQPVVSWKEFTQVDNRVRVKEQISKR